MPRIELTQVSCVYRKASRPALRDVSLTIPTGVTGIVGPNGAGKTTLFRAILGLVLPTAGRIAIDDESPRRYLRRKPVGLIPDAPAFDGYLTAGDFLEGLAALMPAKPMTTRTSPVNIAHLWHTRLDSMSLGERRRVELAAALLGEPELLLLDEPTNGLDPLATIQLRDDLLAQQRTRERTTLIASHHLDELQRLVDRILVVRDGSVAGMWERDDALREFGSFDEMFKSLMLDAAQPAGAAR